MPMSNDFAGDTMNAVETTFEAPVDAGKDLLVDAPMGMVDSAVDTTGELGNQFMEGTKSAVDAVVGKPMDALMKFATLDFEGGMEAMKEGGEAAMDAVKKPIEMVGTAVDGTMETFVEQPLEATGNALGSLDPTQLLDGMGSDVSGASKEGGKAKSGISSPKPSPLKGKHDDLKERHDALAEEMEDDMREELDDVGEKLEGAPDKMGNMLDNLMPGKGHDGPKLGGK